jgi:hypothetical protein
MVDEIVFSALNRKWGWACRRFAAPPARFSLELRLRTSRWRVTRLYRYSVMTATNDA